MLERAGNRITDGTDQAARVSPALQAGYFNVDELIFEELLAMAAAFAAQFKFYPLNNEPGGSWEELFSADEAVVMAMLLSTDLKRAEFEFLRLYPGDSERLAGFVMLWARKVNFWLGRLAVAQHRSGAPLEQKMSALVEEKLAVEFRTLCAVVEHLLVERGREVRLDLAAFGRIWGINQQGDGFVFSRAGVDSAAVREGRPRLRKAFYAFYNAIAHLQGIARGCLQESLQSRRHDPAVGLVMVFLKLYEQAQQRLNRFTQRHLEFYYREVLQAGPRAELPESVYLRFITKPGNQDLLIGKTSEFTAGKDASLKEIVYRSEHDLRVSEARIGALHTLSLQHDELISPETELGYVTRIKCASPSVVETGEEAVPAAWPLFGPDSQVAGGTDAQLGFALASSLLFLQEGTRRIELKLKFTDEQAISADAMLAALLKTHDPAEFTRRFGKLFGQYLLRGPNWLESDSRREISDRALSLLGAKSAAELTELLRKDWQWLFYQQFKHAFSIKLTTPVGWLGIADYTVTPLHEGTGRAGLGLSIVFTLGQELPPVVSYQAALHGGQFATELPLLHCCINPLTNFYPYSLFEAFLLDRLTLEVKVEGVKHLLAYNNHGQLDPSKPFQPFGPLPNCNAYIVVGNYEAAKKRLTGLTLNLEWADLPAEEDGFAEYYRGYGGAYASHRFKGRFEALVDGEWRVHAGESARTVRLFDSDRDGTRVRRARRLSVDLIDDLKPVDSTLREDEFAYNLRARNGFFRLVLSDPPSAFGHRVYPELLTRVLAQNARRKIPLETPNQPYTPSISRLFLDYTARTELRPGLRQAGAGGTLTDTLFHVHPFGVETLFPSEHDKPVSLLPRFDFPGNLFIGIEARALAGPLTLFFHLEAARLQGSPEQASAPAWFYLAADGWRRLPATRVLADTTAGFLTSGTLTLDIPADIVRGSLSMPGDLYWLRLSVGRALHGTCRCHAIQPHAVRLTRALGDGYSNVKRLPREARWQALVALPAIDQIRMVGEPITGRSAESSSELVTRLSERLRHKNRALTAWDYEHLILEHFPQVAKVKCFPHMASDTQAPRPGQVLIVVVPGLRTQTLAGCESRLLSTLELERIKALVQGMASPFVTLEVRNPVYEQVQVRCTVRFSGGMNSGANINRLDRDISDFICPWREQGYRARFGWSIRQKDIEAYLRELDYVEFVTNFSMLHITHDGGRHYSLEDSAREPAASEARIEPKYPWSLAVPASHHFIETTTATRAIEAKLTGIEELEIGNTFIITGSSGHAETD